MAWVEPAGNRQNASLGNLHAQSLLQIGIKCLQQRRITFCCSVLQNALAVFAHNLCTDTCNGFIGQSGTRGIAAGKGYHTWLRSQLQNLTDSAAADRVKALCEGKMLQIHVAHPFHLVNKKILRQCLRKVNNVTVPLPLFGAKALFRREHIDSRRAITGAPDTAYTAPFTPSADSLRSRMRILAAVSLHQPETLCRRIMRHARFSSLPILKILYPISCVCQAKNRCAIHACSPRGGMGEKTQKGIAKNGFFLYTK